MHTVQESNEQCTTEQCTECKEQCTGCCRAMHGVQQQCRRAMHGAVMGYCNARGAQEHCMGLQWSNVQGTAEQYMGL